MTLRSVSLTAGLLLLCAPAFAGEDADADRNAAAPADPDKKTAELASRYDVHPREVAVLRDKGLGWGEVDTALSLSKESGKPVSEIMALRESGKGWGAVAQDLGLKMGELKGRGKGHERDERSDAVKHERRERAERALQRERRHERGRGGGRGRGSKR